MIRCSPSGTKFWVSQDICESRVSFVNVKRTYQIDEDLILDYNLKEEFKSSTRDWIGIFPRNWSNLQQYLTFEYTLSAPPNTTDPLSRKISFPRLFHREAPLNLEYQFVYVSKEIQIVATSTYFRFTTLLCNETVKRCPLTTNVYNTNNKVLSNMTANKTEDTQQPPTQGIRPTCLYCHRKVCGLKIDALRGDFLATFSDSLVNRVRRLERDLSFAESSLKNSKGARENLAKRLQAYEAFVAEMLRSLAVRGVVKITDEKGIEIVLQRVNENDRLAEGDTSRAKNSALEDEIVALKGLLEEQQQTIAKLNERRKFEIPQRDQINCIDREIQTVSNSSVKSKPMQYHITEKQKEEISDDCREKNTSNSIVKTNREKLPLDVDLKTKEIETIDASKLFLMSNKKSGISSKIEPEQVVLKIPKPAGILVHSKDITFAIVRLSESR